MIIYKLVLVNHNDIIMQYVRAHQLQLCNQIYTIHLCGRQVPKPHIIKSAYYCTLQSKTRLLKLIA